jgi:chromosome segregation ATPase
LKEEIARLRQDMAVLAKTMEHLEQTMVSGFTEMRQAISALSMRLDRQETALRQEIRGVRTTSQRQLWVLIGVVIVTMVGGMITMVFFP